MCVIVIGKDEAPALADVRKMWEANPQGAGVCWNDGKQVHYIKGIMELKDLMRMVNKRTDIWENDYIIHFRLASVGGDSKELTHPFVVSQFGFNPLQYDGTAPVLIHNGHDSKAVDMMYESCIMRGKKIPDGEFSDTRAIAVMASTSGWNVCKFFSGKFVIMTPKDITTYGKFEQKEGYQYSNTIWEGRGFCSGSWVGRQSYLDIESEEQYERKQAESEGFTLND